MLGKVFKHDMRLTTRTFIPLIIGFFILTILTKSTFEMASSRFIGGDLLQVIAVIFLMVYIICCIAIFLVTTIFIITHFFNTMTKEQGYLTHTIPVKTSTIITGKVLCGVVWEIIISICFILSLIIFFIGEISWIDIQMFFDELNSFIYSHNLQDSMPLLIFELIFGTVLSLFSYQIEIYAAIAVGHLFQKHKVIGAIASYFGFSIVSSIFLNTLITLFSRSAEIEQYYNIDQFLIQYINGAFFINIAVVFILTIFYFFLTNYIFKKRLNLE